MIRVYPSEFKLSKFNKEAAEAYLIDGNLVYYAYKSDLKEVYVYDLDKGLIGESIHLHKQAFVAAQPKGRDFAEILNDVDVLHATINASNMVHNQDPKFMIEALTTAGLVAKALEFVPKLDQRKSGYLASLLEDACDLNALADGIDHDEKDGEGNSEFKMKYRPVRIKETKKIHFENKHSEAIAGLNRITLEQWIKCLGNPLVESFFRDGLLTRKVGKAFKDGSDEAVNRSKRRRRDISD